MKIVRSKELKYIPASHEDPKNPGVLKKVLFVKDDFQKGRVQMINWALLLKGKSFQKHFHEDMEEMFILVSGKALMTVNGKNIEMEKGDALIVPIKGVHTMVNNTNEDIEYVVVGVTSEQGGKTVVVE